MSEDPNQSRSHWPSYFTTPVSRHTGVSNGVASAGTLVAATGDSGRAVGQRWQPQMCEGKRNFLSGLWSPFRKNALEKLSWPPALASCPLPGMLHFKGLNLFSNAAA